MMSFYQQDASQPQPQSLDDRESLIMKSVTNRFGVLQGDVQIR
tara:strand:- start:474 stop:602 length:129 start_codon:yes stop_codon:yes gene_type:complete